jgi:hypothetical protein
MRTTHGHNTPTPQPLDSSSTTHPARVGEDIPPGKRKPAKIAVNRRNTNQFPYPVAAASERRAFVCLNFEEREMEREGKPVLCWRRKVENNVKMTRPLPALWILNRHRGSVPFLPPSLLPFPTLLRSHSSVSSSKSEFASNHHHTTVRSTIRTVHSYGQLSRNLCTATIMPVRRAKSARRAPQPGGCQAHLLKPSESFKQVAPRLVDAATVT